MTGPRRAGVIRYVTHPEVRVDPNTPIERWDLDDTGLARARAMLDQPWVRSVDRIVTSDETKAVRTAELLGAHLGLDVEIRDGLGEHDRSATGYLPPDEFDATVERFFGAPAESVRGWERAVDAQRRIVDGLADLLDHPTGSSTVVVGHGGVGTLWCCWLTGRPIARAHDQSGQGHYFTVEVTSRTVTHGWLPIDGAPPAT